MKTLNVILLVLVTFQSFSQENNTDQKLEYHSFSCNPFIGFYSDFDTTITNGDIKNHRDYSDSGIVFGADLSFSYLKKHMLTVSFYTGTEFNILGTSNGFSQLNLLYGRHFSLTEELFFETHLGAGYFHFNSRHIDVNRRGQESLDTIGCVSMTKFRVKVGKRFSLGFVFQINLNSIKPIYNSGLIFQWNKKT